MEKTAKKYTDSAWVYLNSESGLYTVGFYAPDGKWQPESDHNSSDKAAERVHYLNGGTQQPEGLAAHILAMADHAYLTGHPEWNAIVEEARRAA